jgi:hypothetical protein
MKNFTQDRQFSGRDLKPEPPGFEVRESATKPPRSLTLHAVLCARFLVLISCEGFVNFGTLL